jgi:predicted aconitase with swiveling domain
VPRKARVLVAGRGAGPALTTDQPLSFWGGVEIATGRIVDRHHPRFDDVVTGRVLVMPSGRGSSSSSSVLAECIRLETGPVAIVLREPDPILVVGAVVARELYGRSIPIVVYGGPPIADGEEVLVDGEWVTIGRT